MSTFFKMRYNFFRYICLAGIVLLAGCTQGSQGTNGTGEVTRGLPATENNPAPAIEKVLAPNPSGDVVGNGNIRIALLAPMSIPGAASAAAKELANGASMAIADFGEGKIQLVIKDTRGQAADAQEKASEAISEGASIVLGPLFAANVSAAAGVTLPANTPILAFSTDTTVARRNVYLFSFTPQSDTNRIVNYATSTGSRSIAAFLPRNAEGALRGRLLREASVRTGFIVNIIEYDRTPEGIDAAISSSGSILDASDSVYVPEGGPIPGLIMGGLRRIGTDISSKRILGSGAWESVKTDDPNLQGAIYPGRDISRFNEFANRYNSKYGKLPGVQAALAYDAVTLVSELVRIHGGQKAFSTSTLENSRGFEGTTGAFRILSDGTTQRGLAIYTIEGGRGKLLEPAVSNFSGRS